MKFFELNSKMLSQLLPDQLRIISYKKSVAGSLLLILLLSFQWNTELQAQIPAPTQENPVALIGGTIHPVAGEVVEDGTILFEDGVITAIGTNIQLPAGTERVNITGKHVYPGLIDAYSQIGLFEIGAVNMTVDLNEQGRINPNAKAEVAFNPESRHIGVARSSGVLVAVSLPGGGLISGQSAAMMLDGWTWAEMVIKSGAGLIVNWPSPGNEDDYDKELQELKDFFANARAYQTAARASEGNQAQRQDFDIRLDAMIPVLEGNIPVIASANDLRQIQDAITWSEEENIRLVILGGRDSHLVASHLVQKNIPVIITSVLTSPSRMWQSYDSEYSLPAKLSEAGVNFALAGTPSAANANRLAFEAGAAAAFGLSEDEALRAITLSPAEILGFDDRVGSLETGKDATLLITTGNPMEYNSQIEQAYIQGRKIDMNDAHRQFFDKYREKIRQKTNQGSR